MLKMCAPPIFEVRDMRSIVMLSLGFLLACAGGTRCETDIPWTDRPVRVDRSAQDYERLPRLTLGLEGGQIIRFPFRLDMHDSASFAADGKEYVLTDLMPVARDRLCTTLQGMRWPCGRNAAIYVNNLFRGRSVTCKSEQLQGRIGLSQCRTPSLHFSYDIVAKGFAFPSGDGTDLEQALAAAKLRRQGIWQDRGCDLSAHSC